MVGKTTPAVELDGGIAVVDFKMQDLGVVLAGDLFGDFEKLGANSLPTMGAFDKEFVNPGADAAVFEAIVKADHQVTNGRKRIFARDIGEAIDRVLQQFRKVDADGGFVEGLFPGVVDLHVAHQFEKGFGVGEGSLPYGDGH